MKGFKLTLLLAAIIGGFVCQPEFLRAQTNYAMYMSYPGDYIGQGVTAYTTNTNNFTFSGTVAGITAGFGYNDTFVPGSGQSLSVGTYSNATRWPFNGTNAGIDTSGDGRGCNNECGTFTILELHTNASGNIDRCWLTFSNRCECGTAAFVGEFRYNSQLAPPVPVPKVIHVPADYATIQAAMNAASPVVQDTVLVSPGTYHEALSFNGKALLLIGVGGASQTILMPPATQTGVNFNNLETSNSVITGFTITGLNAGISAFGCSGSSPLIISNVVAACGNGVYCNNGACPTVVSNYITNCINNPAYIVDAGTAPYFQGNYIAYNGSTIFSAYQASPTLVNNYILHNNSDAISGFNGSAINIIQNVIAYNTGSAVSFSVPSGDRGPFCFNNTIVSNNAGFGISGFNSSSEIINNVVIGQAALNAGGPIVWYNDFYNSGNSAYSGGASNLTGINGNISIDPQFACGISGDFRLLPTSPVINAGSNGAPYLPSLDIIGTTRVIGGKIDMGAFEANPASPVNPCMYVNCPANIVAGAASGHTNAVVNYPAPTGTPGATIAGTPPSGSTFPAGTNTVICTATYGSNTATCSFTITVVLPPSLTNALVVTNVPAGQPFTLAVTPLGSSPFTYQWYFENTAISGGTSNPLTIPNAQEVNEGLYRVVVFNSAGAITNPVASVRVLPTSPTISSNPASLTLPATSTATFQTAAIGSQPLGYQWYFNGSVITGATASQYAISNVQSNNIGNYQVLVTNGLGTATSTVATLTVTPVPPHFTLQPTALSQVSGGSNLTLTAQATGSQPIAYQWKFNGTNLAGMTSTSLQITNLSSANSGSYVLQAASFAGSTNSSVASVVVFQKPTLVSGLSNMVVDMGNTVILSANVLGTQPLGYSWQWNGQPFPGTNATLTLSNIQIMQSGFYVLTATNQYGSTSASARVSVLGLSGTLRIWGDNSGGQAIQPTNVGLVVAMAGGDYHNLALHHDGTVVAWGYNGDNQTSVPTNVARYVTVASGAAHNLAVTDSGSIVAWGRNDAGQCTVPAGLSNAVVAVAAGDSHSLALLNSGMVAGWGDNSFGQISVPQGLTAVKAIAAGREHSVALRQNGTVTAWGYNAYGQATPPAGLSNVVAIAAGYLHSVALMSNGAVACWGDNSLGQCSIPITATNIVAIAAGDYHTVALRQDGTVVCWGSDSLGQLDFPAGLANVTGVACGNYDSLALSPGPGPLVTSMSAGKLVLHWSGRAVLQSAPKLTGPFTDVVGGQGPSYTNTDTSALTKFFRLRQ